MQEDFPIAADRLEGAKEIAREWLGDDNPHAVRKVRYLIDQGVIPVGREGGLIIASKRVLRDTYARMTIGAKQAA